MHAGPSPRRSICRPTCSTASRAPTRTAAAGRRFASRGDGLVITVDDEELFARPIGERTFEVVGGDHAGERFDFPARGLRAVRQPPCGARVVKAAVAAGHPATAEAGAEILQDGGSAADAAVAACLASCVAETVMTGLLGGGHGIYLEAASGTVRNLDCFVAVPSGAGAPMEHLQVPFGAELVDYAVGASSCAVPGLPAGPRRALACSGTPAVVTAGRAGTRPRETGRGDARSARRVPADAGARDDDARRRAHLRARRRPACGGRRARAARPRPRARADP